MQRGSMNRLSTLGGTRNGGHGKLLEVYRPVCLALNIYILIKIIIQNEKKNDQLTKQQNVVKKFENHADTNFDIE